MLIEKYLVLDEDSFVCSDDTGETVLFNEQEAEKVAEYLRKDGSKLVKILPFKYKDIENE